MAPNAQPESQSINQSMMHAIGKKMEWFVQIKKQKSYKTYRKNCYEPEKSNESKTHLNLLNSTHFHLLHRDRRHQWRRRRRRVDNILQLIYNKSIFKTIFAQPQHHAMTHNPIQLFRHQFVFICFFFHPSFHFFRDSTDLIFLCVWKLIAGRWVFGIRVDCASK